jgi:hypothetical protein
LEYGSADDARESTDDAEEIVFGETLEETPSGAEATIEPESADLEPAEEIVDDELLDFFDALKHDAAPSTPAEAEPPELANMSEPVAADDSASAAMLETQPWEPPVEEPQQVSVAEEAATHEAASAETPPAAEPDAATASNVDSDDIFDFVEELAVEDTPPELVSIEDVEAAPESVATDEPDSAAIFEKEVTDTQVTEAVAENIGTASESFAASDDDASFSFEEFVTETPSVEPTQTDDADTGLEAGEMSDVDLSAFFEESAPETPAIEPENTDNRAETAEASDEEVLGFFEAAPVATPEVENSELDAVDVTSSETDSAVEEVLEFTEEPAADATSHETVSLENIDIGEPAGDVSDDDVLAFFDPLGAEPSLAEMDEMEDVAADAAALGMSEDDLSPLFDGLADEMPEVEEAVLDDVSVGNETMPAVEGPSDETDDEQTAEFLFETAEDSVSEGLQVAEPEMTSPAEETPETFEPQSAESRVEDIDFEAPPSEDDELDVADRMESIDEEVALEMDAVEEAEIESLDTSEDEEAVDAEAEGDFEEGNETAIEETTESVTEDDRYAVNPNASGPKAIHASGFAMSALAKRRGKPRRSLLGRLMDCFRRDSDDEAETPESLAEVYAGPEEEAPAEEDMPIEVEEAFDETSQDTEDADEQDAQPHPDPVDDLLRDFL